MIRNRTDEGGSRASWKRKVRRNGKRRKGSRRCCTLVRVQFRVKTLSGLQILYIAVGGGWKITRKYGRVAFLY